MKDTISIRKVSTAEELRQAQEVSVRGFEEEQGVPREINIDGADQSASHVLYSMHGCRLRPRSLESCRKVKGRSRGSRCFRLTGGWASVDTGHYLIRMRKEL